MDPYNPPLAGRSASSDGNSYFVPSSDLQQPYYQQHYAPVGYNNVAYPEITPSVQYNHKEGSVFNNQFVQNVAVQYGTEAFGQGTQLVQEKVEKFLPVSKLKHYFAVDNAYVAGKLGLLVFPFFHKNWDLQYDSTGPVPPRVDINTPDLYIPAMAFITYVIVAGISLGVDGRFAPELLGILSSQSFGWLIFEVCVLTFALYLLNIQSSLSYLDILSYSGYKFIHMITVVVTSLVLSTPGYYFAIIWTGLAFIFFQIRSLKLQILSNGDRQSSMNPRRGVYLLACMSLFQPLIIWWLTSSVVATVTSSGGEAIPN